MAKGITILLEAIQEHAKEGEIRGADRQENIWQPVFRDVVDSVRVSRTKGCVGGNLAKKAFVVGKGSEYDQVKAMMKSSFYAQYISYVSCCNVDKIPWLSGRFASLFALAVADDDFKTSEDSAIFIAAFRWFHDQIVVSERGSRDLYCKGLLEYMLLTALKGFGDYACGLGFTFMTRGTVGPGNGKNRIRKQKLLKRADPCRLVKVTFEGSARNYSTVESSFINLGTNDSIVLGRLGNSRDIGSSKKVVVNSADGDADFTVSRTHCRIWCHDGSWWLDDCSYNGTTLMRRDGEIAVRNNAVPLEAGDIICLSVHSIGFRFEYCTSF